MWKTILNNHVQNNLYNTMDINTHNSQGWKNSILNVKNNANYYCIKLIRLKSSECVHSNSISYLDCKHQMIETGYNE